MRQRGQYRTVGGCAADTAYFTARRREEKFDDEGDTQHTDVESLESKKKKCSSCLFQFTHVPCGKGPYHKLI